MWGLLLAAPVVMTAISAATGLEASLRTEVRAISDSTTEAPVPNFVLDPALEWDYSEKTTRFKTNYGAHLILQPAPSTAATLLHQGGVSYEQRLQHTLRLVLSEGALYGTTNLSPLDQDAALKPQRLRPWPLGGNGPIVGSDTSAKVSWDVSRRLQLNASLAYELFGGANGAMRQLFPLAQGPKGELQSRIGLSRRDSLAATAQVQQMSLSNGARASLLGLEVRWSRQLQPNLRSEIGLGGAQARASTPVDGVFDSRFLPMALASLDYRLPVRPSVRCAISAQVTPFLDPILGGVYDRVDLGGLIRWDLTSDLWITTWGSSAVALGSADRSKRLGGFEAAINYSLARDLWLSGGVGSAWQRETATSETVTQWGGFVALSAAHQKIR